MPAGARGSMDPPDRRRRTLPRLPDLPCPSPFLSDLAPQFPPFRRSPERQMIASFKLTTAACASAELGQRLVPRGDHLVPLDLPSRAAWPRQDPARRWPPRPLQAARRQRLSARAAKSASSGTGSCPGERGSITAFTQTGAEPPGGDAGCSISFLRSGRTTANMDLVGPQHRCGSSTSWIS